eukprot:gnl/MRDRNA2_/MRDRNA2_29680_c0_seq1.p1 gnl/MRDRNA2_/MRDRNA2_29680_c0~~gnl/MRDRNA2_/MRDRNA2_29680_c0_seq1.p1  ORF type:complete len:193 (+),score=22.78 gnl/MRDRNA2_/MRDRNA2_29680_c0_seq1:97-675(+)
MSKMILLILLSLGTQVHADAGDKVAKNLGERAKVGTGFSANLDGSTLGKARAQAGRQEGGLKTFTSGNAEDLLGKFMYAPDYLPPKLMNAPAYVSPEQQYLTSLPRGAQLVGRNYLEDGGQIFQGYLGRNSRNNKGGNVVANLEGKSKASFTSSKAEALLGALMYAPAHLPPKPKAPTVLRWQLHPGAQLVR